MKKRICLYAMLVFFLIGNAMAMAYEDKIEQADALFEKGGLDGYKEAVDIYMEVIEENPDSFEVNWKLARALREYGEEHMRLGINDYEAVCAEYGKKGMAYAERAIELEPDEPGGYLFYGISVGTYSNGVGIFTALREGLKDKTQTNLEKAYEIDPLFQKGAPILSIGRFWHLVPWPYRDTSKAEAFYREFQATEFYQDNAEARIYLAELLDGKRGSRHDDEARALLEEALELDAHEYWHKEARTLLNSL